MTDNIQFTAPKELQRTIRSNNGADALFVDTITTLFGIDRNCAYDILRMLEQTEQLGNLRKSIKLLSIQDHTELNNILARYDNHDELDTDVSANDDTKIDQSDNISKYVNRLSSDSWNPEQAKNQSEERQNELPSIAKASDYNFSDRVKEGKSFIGFLMKEAIINKDDAAINAADDDQFDDNTKRQIQAMVNSGNLAGANQLRANMKKKLQLKPQQPVQKSTDSLDLAVERAKAQYAQALRNRDRQRAQQKVV